MGGHLQDERRVQGVVLLASCTLWCVDVYKRCVQYGRNAPEGTQTGESAQAQAVKYA
jgi:hypothetical protein